MKKERYYYSLPIVKTEAIAAESYLFVDGGYNPNAILAISKSLKPQPRITICSILDTDDETLSFGAALCSKRDRFCKKIGRELSYNRALNNPMRVVSVKGQNVNQIRIQICNELETEIFSTNPVKF